MAHEIALLVMTDGRRDELRRTMHSASTMLRGHIGSTWIHDDTGDDSYRLQLQVDYPTAGHLGSGERRGFGGALAFAWHEIAVFSSADFVFHLEADFTFNRVVDLDAMARVLSENVQLAQMALRRQAWAPAEIEAGGVVEMHPHAYMACWDLTDRWLEHELFYTTNPHLVRMDLVRRGWPVVPRSEAAYTDYLLREGLPWEMHGDRLKFGYWGERHDKPWVHHIGNERAGHGY